MDTELCIIHHSLSPYIYIYIYIKKAMYQRHTYHSLCAADLEFASLCLNYYKDVYILRVLYYQWIISTLHNNRQEVEILHPPLF